MNFFNVSAKKEKSESKSTKASKTNSSSSSKTVTSDSSKSDSPQKATKSKPNVPVKKEFTKEIQKTIKFKTKTSTVQALKKKYLEQRLAKQRIKNKIKASYVIRTRSCTERTIGKPVDELSTRNFLPKAECKRRGLRSGGFVEKTVDSKVTPKIKRSPMKPKKRVLAKSKSNESSNSDSTSDDEATKSSYQVKKVTKPVPKKVCTRNKSELRRVTRSFVETKSPQHLSRRPTRKTKEAAAIYMEILGRKLVSPELENDEDSISLDSFPELPNARRSLKEEIEIKAKVKQNSKSGAKEKESKGESIVSSKKIDNLRTVKTVLKSKRLVKIHKYCELETDEESESSSNSEKSSKNRPITRRSLNKPSKPTSRSLRSSSRNTPMKVKIQSSEIQTFVGKKENQGTIKSVKEKVLIKRKREQIEKKEEEKKQEGKKVECRKENDKIDESKSKEIRKEVSKKEEIKKEESKKEDAKKDSKKEEGRKDENKKEIKKDEVKTETKKEEIQKELKRDEVKKEETKYAIANETNKLEKNADTEEGMEDSDEETLCSILNKMKKKKEADDEALKKVESNKMKVPKEVSKIDPRKISDDEESFRGFTKKAISKVLDSCQSHVNANLLVSNDVDPKSLPLEKPLADQVESPLKIKDDKPSVLEPTLNMPLVKSTPLLIENTTPKAESVKQDKICNHKSDIGVNIIDMPSSAMLGRKERVNMSNEQIEKWLNESSLAKEESKVEMENVSNFNYETAEKPKVSSHHLSISSKIQHLVRPVNVTLAKLNDKSKGPKLSSLVVLNPQNSSIRYPSTFLVVKNKCPPEIETKEQTVASKPCPDKVNKESACAEDSDAVSKSDQNSLDGSPDKKSLEKKVLSQPRKLFLPKVKERKITTPSANAFSPENESSVYAFESDTEVPISTPFRRKNKPVSPLVKGIGDKDNSNKDNMSSVTESFKIPESKKETETQLNPAKINTIDLKSFANLANMQVLSLEKLTTNWSNVNCSASIAVQVNLDEQNQEVQNAETDENSQQKSIEISTQTEESNDNDDDNDGQLFYIPLQALTRNGSNLVQGQQLIQGVAVKLGTEGPTGPNQRVLLKAKLVTKPPLTIARVPPVGTVQPTARAPPVASTSTAEHPIASTSTAVSISSISELRPVVSNKEANTIQVEFLQPGGTSAVIEKVAKSPKTPRERKTSVDSGKPGKR